MKKYHSNYWTKDKVIEYIKKLHSKGESLKSWDIRNNHTSVYHASYKLFNNWQKAVEASGIDYISLLKNPWKYNKKNIKEKMIELHNQKVNLSDSSLRRYNNNFYSAVTKRFGSIGNALLECGIDPHQYYKQKPTGYWTEERILSDAKNLKDLGENLSSQSVRKKYSALWYASMKKFKDVGGWIHVLQKIGVEANEVSRLYANTKEFKKYLKSQLTKEKLEDLYYSQGYSELAIGELYGCGYKPVKRLLKEYSLIPKKAKFGSKSRIICSDGHKVYSSYEMQVCEWLTKHGIKHDHDVKLNYGKWDGNERIKVPKYRPDFLIKHNKKTYYIEIWGLQGQKKYDEKIKKKLDLYRELREKFGYELIEIWPNDILAKKLGFLINNHS